MEGLAQLSYPVQMEIAGDSALFTRPDTGDSPASYAAPTYSAVQGIFSSVLWLPDVQIIPRKVELCAPPTYHSYVTNYGGPLRKSDAIRKGNNYQLYATILIDVCYRLYADVMPVCDKSTLPQNAREWDRRTTSPGHAYQAIFNRRLERGQAYATVALGWSDFRPSYFGPFRASTHVCSDLPDILIPSMLREVFPGGYGAEYRPTFDVNVCIHKGVLTYPVRGEEGL